MSTLTVALLLFTISFLFALVLTPAVFLVPSALRIVAKPAMGGADAAPLPTLGGAAVFVAFMLSLLWLAVLGPSTSAHLLPGPALTPSIVLCAAAMFCLGLVDDLKGVRFGRRIPVQLILSIGLYILGLRIDRISNPFGQPIQLGAFAPLVTAVWIVGITNAMDIMSGFEGLAAGVCAMTAVVLGLAPLQAGSASGLAFAMSLAGASAGFLLYSFPPARILLGHSGSLFLGALLATISLQSSQKGPVAVAVLVPMIALALPVAGISLAVARRFLTGRDILEADHRHVHDMLLALGLSKRRVLLILYGVTAAFGAAALLLVDASIERSLLIVGIVLCATAAATARLGYHEFRHLWDFLKLGMAYRSQLVFKRHVLKSASDCIATHDTFDAMWHKVETVTKILSFDRVVFEPSGPADERLPRRVWARTHAIEAHPLTAHIEIPVASAGQRYGTLVFERQRSPHALRADAMVLDELGSCLAARLLELQGQASAANRDKQGSQQHPASRPRL